MLRALLLTDVDGRSGFDYIAADGSGGEAGWHVVGTIDAGGTIHAGGMIDAGGTMAVSRRDPSSLGLGSDPNRLHQGGSQTIPGSRRPLEADTDGVDSSDTMNPSWVGRVTTRHVMPPFRFTH